MVGKAIHEKLTEEGYTKLLGPSSAELDLRDQQEHRNGKGSCMMAWCHGAPGIGLARLNAIDSIGDDRLYDDIDAAIESTLAAGFGHNQCLCHGDLGNLIFLYEAGVRLGDAVLVGQVKRLTASVLGSLKGNDYLCGIPLAQETPGLMTGLAGIGYGLLRLAAPDRVPSVLTLEVPPVEDTTPITSGRRGGRRKMMT